MQQRPRADSLPHAEPRPFAADRALNTIHGRGWRVDHSPFIICGDGSGRATYRDDPDALAPPGGTSHGHVWDPECRYHFANGQMRGGLVVLAFQLTDVEEGWGGFGIMCARPPSFLAGRSDG